MLKESIHIIFLFEKKNLTCEEVRIKYLVITSLGCTKISLNLRKHI
jgi:hypothetical protein